MKKAIILFICLIGTFSVKGQGSWSSWVTVYQDDAYPTPHYVQVSYKMAAFCGGYSHYRTNTNFSGIEYGTVSFYFDYLDCDGLKKSEQVTVALDKPGVDFTITGMWFIGSKVVTQFRNVKPYFPRTSSKLNSSSSQDNQASASFENAKKANSDKAILLKPDLDYVLNKFNATYLAAVNKLSTLKNLQQATDYKQKLENCKTQFADTYQIASLNYQKRDGDKLNDNITALKDLLSNETDYLNMEGDVRLIPDDPASKPDAPTIQNNQQAVVQYHLNQAANSSTDAITQAAQLSVAKINIAYQQAHGNNSAALLQQKLQVIQLEQQQKQQNIQNTANLIISTFNLLNTLNFNDNAEAKLQADVAKIQQQSRRMWQSYNDNFGGLQVKIDTEIANDPQNKEVYFQAGLLYMRIGDRYGNLVQKGDIDSLPCTTTKDVKILINKLNDFKRLDNKNIQYHNYSEAAGYFKKAISIDPNYFAAIENWAYVSIIPTMDLYKFYEKGILMNKEWRGARASAEKNIEIEGQYLQKAVDLEPKNKIALNNLVGYYIIIGNDKKAKELKKRIADIN
jgi:phosphoribosylanthranilate isomerase